MIGEIDAKKASQESVAIVRRSRGVFIGSTLGRRTRWSDE